MTLSKDPAPRQGTTNPEEELYELLKQAEDDTKLQLESNQEQSTVGTQQIYKDPKGREKGTLDAPWGEKSVQKDGKNEPFHNSSGIWEGHQDTRYGVLQKAFSGFDQAADAAKGLISQNFNTKDYVARTALLAPKQEQQVKVSHPREPTLLERVKGLTGRP